MPFPVKLEAECAVFDCHTAKTHRLYERWGTHLLCEKHAQQAARLILATGTRREMAACRIEALA